MRPAGFLLPRLAPSGPLADKARLPGRRVHGQDLLALGGTRTRGKRDVGWICRGGQSGTEWHATAAQCRRRGAVRPHEHQTRRVDERRGSVQKLCCAMLKVRGDATRPTWHNIAYEQLYHPSVMSRGESRLGNCVDRFLCFSPVFSDCADVCMYRQSVG